jgi:hypothetical protein
LVMETLRNNQLFAKLSKCTFCEESWIFWAYCLGKRSRNWS